MKKIIYITAILIYAAFAIAGFAGSAYIEAGAGDKLLKSHGVWIAVAAINKVIIFFFMMFKTK